MCRSTGVLCAEKKTSAWTDFSNSNLVIKNKWYYKKTEHVVEMEE